MSLLEFIESGNTNKFIELWMNTAEINDKRQLLKKSLIYRQFDIAKFLLMNGVGLLHSELHHKNRLPKDVYVMLQNYEKSVLESSPEEITREIKNMDPKDQLLLAPKFALICLKNHNLDEYMGNEKLYIPKKIHKFIIFVQRNIVANHDNIMIESMNKSNNISNNKIKVINSLVGNCNFHVMYMYKAKNIWIYLFENIDPPKWIDGILVYNPYYNWSSGILPSKTSEYKWVKIYISVEYMKRFHSL